jgi:hypothetical protein
VGQGKIVETDNWKSCAFPKFRASPWFSLLLPKILGVLGKYFMSEFFDYRNRNGFEGSTVDWEITRPPQSNDCVPGLDMETVTTLVSAELWPGRTLVGMAYLQPPENWEPSQEIETRIRIIEEQIRASESPSQDLEYYLQGLLNERVQEFQAIIQRNPSPTLLGLRHELRLRAGGDDIGAMRIDIAMEEYAANWPIDVLLAGPNDSTRAIAVTYDTIDHNYRAIIIGTSPVSADAFELVESQLQTGKKHSIPHPHNPEGISGRGSHIICAVTKSREMQRLPGGGVMVTLVEGYVFPDSQ